MPVQCSGDQYAFGRSGGPETCRLTLKSALDWHRYWLEKGENAIAPALAQVWVAVGEIPGCPDVCIKAKLSEAAVGNSAQAVLPRGVELPDSQSAHGSLCRRAYDCGLLLSDLVISLKSRAAVTAIHRSSAETKTRWAIPARF